MIRITCVGLLLRDMGRDESSDGHQSQSQDKTKGEVNEGSATQQDGQVQHSHELQDPPPLFGPLSGQQPATNEQN